MMYALNSNFTTLCIDLTLTHKALPLKCATPNCFCLADFRLLKTVGLGVPSIAYSIQSGMVWVGNSIKSNPGGGGFNWTLLYRKNAVGPIRVVGTRPKHSCCEPALLLCTHVCGYKLNTTHRLQSVGFWNSSSSHATAAAKNISLLICLRMKKRETVKIWIPFISSLTEKYKMDLSVSLFLYVAYLLRTHKRKMKTAVF